MVSVGCNREWRLGHGKQEKSYGPISNERDGQTLLGGNLLNNNSVLAESIYWLYKNVCSSDGQRTTL